MSYSLIDRVYAIFIDVMNGVSSGSGNATFYNTDSHTSFIEVGITNGHQEFNMMDYSYFLMIKKPDGTEYRNELTAKDSAKLLIALDAQMLSSVGKCDAQLYVTKVVGGTNKVLTLIEFNYIVKEGSYSELAGESKDFDSLYVRMNEKLDFIIERGAFLTGEQATQLTTAYNHSQSPHAPANIVDIMNDAIDDHHKKVALGVNNASQFSDSNITINPSQEGLTKNLSIYGRTLQNLLPLSGNYNIMGSVISSNVKNFKLNTEYTMIVRIKNSKNPKNLTGLLGRFYRASNTTAITVLDNQIIKDGEYRAKFTLDENIKSFEGLWGRTQEQAGDIICDYEYIFLEGDYTQPNSNIPPYFEGIKSVGGLTPEGDTKIVYGSHGKNLMKIGTFTVQATEAGIAHVGLDRIIERNIEVDPKKTYSLSYTTNKEGLKCCKILGCNTPLPHTFTYHNTAYSFCINNGGAERTAVISGYKYLTITTGGSVPSDIVQVGETINISELQLEEGTQATAYEPYQEDKKEFIIPQMVGLKGLPNGITDELYEYYGSQEAGVVQKVAVSTFDGSPDEEWAVTNAETEVLKLNCNSIVALTDNNETVNTISDKLPSISHARQFNHRIEGVCIGGANNSNGRISVNILKSKLESPDLAGFKKWLAKNPLTVYYHSKNYIYHALTPAKTDPNVKTYKEITHIFADSAVKPKIKVELNFVSLSLDTKQYHKAVHNCNFLLPNTSQLANNSGVQIHLVVAVDKTGTLSFPSNILWDATANLIDITEGAVVEFVLTYIKTSDGDLWLGTAHIHR